LARLLYSITQVSKNYFIL